MVLTEREAEDLLGRALAALPEPTRTAARTDAVGAVVADARHILAGNAYFLALVRAPAGPGGAREVPWVRLTPPELISRDAQGIGQARIHGASDAYEKAYLFPDGSRTPLLVAVGMLGPDPLPLFGLLARADDAAACDAVRAWTGSPDRDLRPRLAASA